MLDARYLLEQKQGQNFVLARLCEAKTEKASERGVLAWCLLFARCPTFFFLLRRGSGSGYVATRSSLTLVVGVAADGEVDAHTRGRPRGQGTGHPSCRR